MSDELDDDVDDDDDEPVDDDGPETDKTRNRVHSNNLIHKFRTRFKRGIIFNRQVINLEIVSIMKF
jgi:hypothetical protein